MRLCAPLCALLVLTVPLFGQDETAKTFHIFPQIADGGGADGSTFSSWLFVTNVSFENNNHCTYRLNGVGADRLVLIDSGPATRTTYGATFTLSQAVAATVVPTQGIGNLQAGYATLQCTYPVTAFVWYGFSDSFGQIMSMATVFSSQPARGQFYWVIQGLGSRLGLAIVNDANRDTSCELTVYAGAGTPLGPVTLPLKSKGHLARFVDELVTFPNDSEIVGGAANLICDSPVSTIGLFFIGTVFTTVPASVFLQ